MQLLLHIWALLFTSLICATTAYPARRTLVPTTTIELSKFIKEIRRQGDIIKTNVTIKIDGLTLAQTQKGWLRDEQVKSVLSSELSPLTYDDKTIKGGFLTRIECSIPDGRSKVSGDELNQIARKTVDKLGDMILKWYKGQDFKTFKASWEFNGAGKRKGMKSSGHWDQSKSKWVPGLDEAQPSSPENQ